MITKQQLKSRNGCKLTFELPSEFEAQEVQLLADFNGWEPVSMPRLKSGKWKLTQEVEPGHEYQFRYRVLHENYADYLNDEQADGVVPNDKGTENAVIVC